MNEEDALDWIDEILGVEKIPSTTADGVVVYKTKYPNIFYIEVGDWAVVQRILG